MFKSKKVIDLEKLVDSKDREIGGLNLQLEQYKKQSKKDNTKITDLEDNIKLLKKMLTDRDKKIGESKGIIKELKDNLKGFKSESKALEEAHKLIISKDNEIRDLKAKLYEYEHNKTKK